MNTKTINTNNSLDIKLTNLTKIKLEHNLDINKNVVIALNSLNREEQEKTIQAILFLKENWQESPLINEDKHFYGKKVDQSLIILFKIAEDGVINIIDLTRIERIKHKI